MGVSIIRCDHLPCHMSREMEHKVKGEAVSGNGRQQGQRKGDEGVRTEHKITAVHRPISVHLSRLTAHFLFWPVIMS